METLLMSEDIQTQEQFWLDHYKRTFPSAAKYIRQMGGTLDDAKDIFQDALIVYYEKDKMGMLPAGLSEKAYLLGISRNLWLHKFRNGQPSLSLEELDFEPSADEKESLPLQEKLLHYLETAGQKCMELLKAFYYDKSSPRELQTKFGYTSERSATVQKYKCLEKVRNEVRQKSMRYEDFLD